VAVEHRFAVIRRFSRTNLEVIIVVSDRDKTQWKRKYVLLLLAPDDDQICGLRQLLGDRLEERLELRLPSTSSCGGTDSQRRMQKYRSPLVRHDPADRDERPAPSKAPWSRTSAGSVSRAQRRTSRFSKSPSSQTHSGTLRCPPTM